MSYNFEFTNGILTGTSASSGSPIGRKLYTFTNGILTNVEDTAIDLNVRNAFVFNNGILTARTSASTSGSTSFEGIPYFHNPIDTFNNATAIDTFSSVYSTPESSLGTTSPHYVSGVSGDYIFGHKREGTAYFINRKNIRSSTSGSVGIPLSSMKAPAYFPMSDDYGVAMSGVRVGSLGSITFSSINWTSGSAAIDFVFNYAYGVFPDFSNYSVIGVAKDVVGNEVYILFALTTQVPPEIPPVDLIRYVVYGIYSKSIVYTDDDPYCFINDVDGGEYADMGDGKIGYLNYYRTTVLDNMAVDISILDIPNSTKNRINIPISIPNLNPQVSISPEYSSGCSIAIHGYNISSSLVNAFRVYTSGSGIESVFSLIDAPFYRPLEMSFSKEKVLGSYYDPALSGCSVVYDFSTGCQVFFIPQGTTMIAKSLDDIGNNMIICVSGSTSGSIFSGSITDALYRVNSSGGSAVIHRFDDQGLWADSARDLRLYDEKITYSQDDEDVKIVIFN